MNPLKQLVPPVAVVLGSPRQAAELAAGLAEVVCYQMDLYQAGRLREELDGRPSSLVVPPSGGDASPPEGGTTNRLAQVVTAADLWDLPADFRTVLYPAAKGGERGLKIDMVEQAFHILRPGDRLYVLSPYAGDDLFAPLLKKVFGKVHGFSPSQGEEGGVVWARREGDRPRRRHEVAFHARVDAMDPLRFVSRPGTFSCGKFDLGARALVETMRIDPGERILDLGCGCGTNGVVAGRRSGPKGQVVFVDCNVRAVALAELNARAADLPSFEARAAVDAAGLEPESFDVVLANPPYYAEGQIARRFIEQSRSLLRPGGRLYLVTKQTETVLPLLAERFEAVEGTECRGYEVLEAKCTSSSGSWRVS